MAYVTTHQRNWATTQALETEEIPTKKGLYHGDALSGRGSNILNKTQYRYKIDVKDDTRPINYILYMEDLKIYVSTETQLNKIRLKYP